MTKRIGSLLGGARLVVAGSTLDGEEEALLAAWPAIHEAVPDAVLLIAPRHPDRFGEVEGLVRKTGYLFFRCSQLMLATEPISGGTILLLDTIGDLASVYGVATVAFVGGSLVAKGGHNPLEPAQFGVPVVMGPSYENFREVVERMREAMPSGLCRVRDWRGRWWRCCGILRGHGLWESGGAMVFEQQAGATGRTVEALTTLLKERPVS